MSPSMIVVFLSAFLLVDASLIKIVTHNDEVEIDIEENPDPANPEGDRLNPVNNGQIVMEEGVQTADDDRPPVLVAKTCDRRRCRLPNCRCTGVDIPGNVPKSHTPQMIVFTFSNAVRPQDMHLYEELFDGRKNPNGCPASASFYVSGNWTYFGDVNRLYSKGHEIGNSGVNEETPEWYRQANYHDWLNQMTNEYLMLVQFAKVHPADVRGWRSPFLWMGGDKMAWALAHSGMRYESTVVGYYHQDYWPFSYDYKSNLTSTIGVPINNSYPGLWEVPIEPMYGADGYPCADIAACNVSNEEEAYDLLYKGFEKRYKSNKAPMTLQVKVDWLMNSTKMAATKRFLDKVMKYHDVYVVSAWRALSWVRRPQSVFYNPAAFRCTTPPPSPCPNPKRCAYDTNRRRVDQGGFYITSVCDDCPACYPALGDPLGRHC